MTDKPSDRTLLVLYPGLDEAAGACRSLVDQGFTPEALSALSDIPVKEEVLPIAEPKLSLQWFALAAAFVGIAGGVALTVGTSLAYPIRTGHMSVLPIPPYAIIAYELMMLAVIVTTVAGFAIAILRGRRRDALYDDGVATDEIGVLVYCADEEAEQKARAILGPGGPLRILSAPGRQL